MRVQKLYETYFFQIRRGFTLLRVLDKMQTESEIQRNLGSKSEPKSVIKKERKKT